MNETQPTGLTPEQVRLLRKPFQPREHEFNYDGWCYISEEAVTNRLDEVAPDWQFVIVDKEWKTALHAVVEGYIEINGVRRYGVGEQVSQTGAKKISDGKMNDGSMFVAGAEQMKGAATDCLRRCARLFGIGRYLLSLPSSGGNSTIKDERALATWLTGWAKENGYLQSETPAATADDVQTSAQVDATTKAKLGSGDGERRIPQSPPARSPKLEIHTPKGALWDADALKAQTIDAYENNQWEQANSINKMIAAGDLRADMPDKYAECVVLFHQAHKRFGLTPDECLLALSAAGMEVTRYSEWKQDGKAAWQAIVAYKENDPFADDALPKTGTEG